MRRSLGLTPKVTAAFALFAIVLVTGLGVLAYNSGRSSLEAATFAEMLSIAVEKEASFNAWIGDSLSRVTALAGSSRVRDSVNIMLNTNNVFLGQGAHDTIIEELRLSLGRNSPFTNLFVLHPETARVEAATNTIEEGHFQEDRAYFINGRVAPYVQTVYYSLETQSAAMAVSAPIHKESGELLGVLVGELNLFEMGSIINRHADFRQTDDAFLVNKSNLFVTQPRFMTDAAVLQRGIYSPSVKNCLNGESGNTLADDYRGVPSIVSYRWLPEQQLCLIVKIDQAEAFQPVQAFGVSLAGIGTGLLLVGIILAVALARTITRPVVVLQKGVIRFAEGDLTTRLPETSNDELGVLAHQFNAMAEAIAEKDKLVQIYTKELEQRVAERTARLAFLAEASALLSESFDFEASLKQLAQAIVPQIADLCTIEIMKENDQLTRLVVVHQNPEIVDMIRHLEEHFADTNIMRGNSYRVLKSGQSELIPEVTDAMLQAAIKAPELLALMLKLGMRSTLTVPLVAHGRVLGTITLLMLESGRHFTMADRELLEDLGRRAGLLVDNAKLYSDTQKMNEELEQRVTDRTAQLVGANKELEAFSYSVSHDLRAPLRALDGFSNALQEDYADVLDDEGKDFLHRIRAASQRMGELIDDLHALSRYTRAEMVLEKVDLSAICSQIATTLCETDPNRSVTFDIQPTPDVRGDPRLLRAMLENLLGNAWKFTSKRSDARIEFGMQLQGETRVYFVKDNGAGFDMAYVNKLFGAFQRLHKTDEFDGTGIGLATVQRIILRHGGQIWAEGVVNQGATFYFSFDATN